MSRGIYIPFRAFRVITNRETFRSFKKNASEGNFLMLHNFSSLFLPLERRKERRVFDFLFFVSGFWIIIFVCLFVCWLVGSLWHTINKKKMKKIVNLSICYHE